MGVEGRDKVKTLDTGAAALSNQLGKTVQRLRKAYNLSLSELSGQSGVAKSIISQIERNETNPTLATIWRLSQALDVSIERVLRAAETLLRRRVCEPLQRRAEWLAACVRQLFCENRRNRERDLELKDGWMDGRV